MKPLKLRILDWNRDRNGLVFDGALESLMLLEEANEFFHADSVVDRIDAYCDYLFVWNGTVSKFFACTAPAMEWQDFNTCEEYVGRTLKAMEDILFPELEMLSSARYNWNYELKNTFLEIIVAANEAKGYEKDESGKVMKGADYVAPEDTIAQTLEGYLVGSR